MTLNELAQLLARAPLLGSERKAWFGLIPFLTVGQLLELGGVLKTNVSRASALKESFQADFFLIKKAEELRAAKSDLV
jgi:hypothetical protein